MKREIDKYDFKAIGQAIKAARKAKGISRNQLADQMHIAPRYIASIENSGQHPSLQIFYELVTLLDVSVDQFFFPNAYSVCILPPARYFSATLPNKTRHRAGAVCHCIAGAKALPEVCVLAKPLRQRCNWSINLHRRNWQPM